MSKTVKIIISSIGFLVLVAGIGAGVYLVQKNQDIREKAAPATNLSFSPSSVSKNPGQSVNLTINADTGENKVTGVDIEISYNPSVIQLTQMTPTSAISNLSTIIKNGEINNTTGKARFAAFTVTKSQAVSGNIGIINLTGTIANGAVAGNYPITFTETTTISAADEGQNVIVNKSSASIVVSSGGNATVQPTATSIANQPTATSRASATATAKATSTAVSTKTPTSTPTSGSGTGGSNVTLPTKTPTPKTTSLATVPPDLPVTGVSFPVLGGISLGMIVIIASLFLAF